MTLLDRYLIKSLLTIAVFAALVFTLCWLAPEIMFNAIQGVTQGKLTVEQGLSYLLYQIPEVLTYCLPITALMASVFLFRQLGLSGELIAMTASGIAFRRLLVPVGAVGLLIGILFFLTQEIFVPWASLRFRELNQVTHFDDGGMTAPHVTYVEKTKDGRLQKFLVISPEGETLQNRFIFLFYNHQGETTWVSRILTATRGTWDEGSSIWHLQDGVDYELSANGIYRHVAAFRQQEVRTSPIAHALLAFPVGNPSEFTIKQLERYVRLLSRGRQTEDAKFYEVRLFQRYFLPLTPLVFAVLGAAIGVERNRARRNLGLTYAALLLLFYNIMVPVSTTLGSLGILPAVVAALFPVVAATLAGWGILKLRQSET